MTEIESTSANKRKVIVHVTFIKVGEINTMKEVYDADILLRARWREPELDKSKIPVLPDNYDFSKLWNPKIYIDNVVGEPKRTSSMHVEYDANGQGFCVERRRVKGTFLETMELFEFPFDVQDLSVTVMSDCPVTEVEVAEDPDESHKVFKRAFIDEQEWYLYKYIESEAMELMKDRADPTLMASALIVRCKAARRPWYFVWNNFTLTLLITCLSFVTFAVPCTKPQNRLQLSFTLVLTAVAFKFVVNQSLPRISYLTYLDRYILASMSALTVVCFWHAFITVLPQTTVRGESVDTIALAVFIGLYVIYNIQFFLRLYAIPFKRRRTMRANENKYEEKVRSEAETKMSQKKAKSKAQRFKPQWGHGSPGKAHKKKTETDVATTATPEIEKKDADTNLTTVTSEK